MRRFPPVEVFVIVWQSSFSVAHASEQLSRKGYWWMTQRRVRRWVRTLREVGVRLRRINWRLPEDV